MDKIVWLAGGGWIGKLRLTSINIKFKLKLMQTVTMVDFRRDAASVLRALRRGERVLLTYRGKAVARLEPVRARVRSAEEDPLFRLYDEAVDSPVGPLDHGAIDAHVYG